MLHVLQSLILYNICLTVKTEEIYCARNYHFTDFMKMLCPGVGYILSKQSLLVYQGASWMEKCLSHLCLNTVSLKGLYKVLFSLSFR